jgi:hypothetical protein
MSLESSTSIFTLWLRSSSKTHENVQKFGLVCPLATSDLSDQKMSKRVSRITSNMKGRSRHYNWFFVCCQIYLCVICTRKVCGLKRPLNYFELLVLVRCICVKCMRTASISTWQWDEHHSFYFSSAFLPNHSLFSTREHNFINSYGAF